MPSQESGFNGSDRKVGADADQRVQLIESLTCREPSPAEVSRISFQSKDYCLLGRLFRVALDFPVLLSHEPGGLQSAEVPRTFESRRTMAMAYTNAFCFRSSIHRTGFDDMRSTALDQTSMEPADYCTDTDIYTPKLGAIHAVLGLYLVLTTNPLHINISLA